MSYVTEYAPLQPVLDGADHVDVKVITAEIGLREFVAGALSYNPGWVKALYGVRAGFVRLLGMRQEGIPPSLTMRAEDVSMTPGEAAAFFTVTHAEEEGHWVAAATDRHLTAHLGVVVEPLDGARRRFHVVTVVHYHNWAGPVYFNVIRPFHHLVVAQMIRAGARGGVAATRV